MTDKVKTKKSITYQIVSWLLVIVVAFAVAMLVRTFLVAPVKVDGRSMEPTYQDGNHLFIEKITKPDRFDKVVFDAPTSTGDEGSYFIKRVIGVSGDKIEFKDSKLYVNGKKYKEDYLAKGMPTYSQPGSNRSTFTLKDITGHEKVPKGKLFVLGDNREGSMDSRMFGFIDESAVDGVVISFSKK
ncbi:type I signal peptidase SipY [Listeria sp. PSOL-1]|uniref:type I signal peptidase SipY n=1 Tax=Listeria sp. PSOL-1 TaxID=1844999 RepID=UPI0013D1C416|nr:type I signal peptidase SipY [Listeria sp. PSOL-1]